MHGDIAWVPASYARCVITRRSDRRGCASRVRVLAIHRYYWPDSPPYASMLRAITAQWVRDGASVRVLGTQPSYKPAARIPRRPWKETLDGASVERVRLLDERQSRVRKLLNMPLFVAQTTFRVLRVGRGDVVMCSTAPPVVLAAAVSLAARAKGARFIYHCMDIHPEIGALSGEFRNPLVFRLLRHIDRATCRRADTVVVLSREMRQALLDRDERLADKIEVLNNFNLPEFAETGHTQVRQPPPRRATVRLVFTGNVGRFQGLDDVVRSVLVTAADVELIIMGDGRAKPGLERLVGTYPIKDRARVTFVAHGSPAQARAVMRTADIGLVSLAPRIIRYAYPSKTMTYLSEGLPLLLLAETDSELVRSIEAEQIGFGVKPGDSAGLAAVLEHLESSTSDLIGMSQRAREFADREFDATKVLQRWSHLLDRVRNGRPTRA